MKRVKQKLECSRPPVLLILAVGAALGFGIANGRSSDWRPPAGLASLEQAAAAKEDVWGLAAMRQTNGPSYEFFKRILPPLRYVNADFRYYPIVLSAPEAGVKARLISNGSGLNLRGGARSWRDAGVPFTFRVGPDQFLFGGVQDRVAEPTLEEGWLPIFQIRYLHQSPQQAQSDLGLTAAKPKAPPEVYQLEAFASTDPALASNGVVFVKFELVQGVSGQISVQPGDGARFHFDQGKVMDESGRVIALFDSTWKWDGRLAAAQLKPGENAVLAVATEPLAPGSRLACTAEEYSSQRDACAQTWRQVLAQGMNVETPELVVNNAWRHLLVQNFALIHGNSIHYSAGNQYDKLYESEGSDAATAMLGWGFDREVGRLIVPLLDFTRKDLELHQAGFKLEDLCEYYWKTRDSAAIHDLQPRWEREVRLLALSHTNGPGLGPEQQYCGDISTMVYSLTVNAKAWRALRDFSAVLAQTGYSAEAEDLAANAAEFRKTIRQAVAQSVHRDISPPFVPVALEADEPTHDPITASRIGTYWNIVIGYVIGSGIFPPGSAEENWIPHYQEEHGGLCMGMLRAGGGYTFWPGAFRMNPLYGTRYALDTLRRDDPERALVSFYGMLAQGLTRNTFIGAEGSSLTPSDDHGRFMYCPPNSAANAHLLAILRGLLVQDWDLDDDGAPETLRLLFATPKRWLEDGKRIRIERAPTAFGPVSLSVESRLSEGKVIVRAELPTRNTPKRILLRARVPDGWRVTAAKAGTLRLLVDKNGTADISSFSGEANIEFEVSRIRE